MKHKVVIFGGTGFIGKSLTKHLTLFGYDIIVIGRNRPKMFLFELLGFAIVNGFLSIKNKKQHKTACSIS